MLILNIGHPQRGIDVMVEIDTPGHTAIIAEAHPEFIACPGATPWATYANGTYTVPTFLPFLSNSPIQSLLRASSVLQTQT